MTGKEMADVLGHIGAWTPKGCSVIVRVKIVDVKSAYGRVRYQVTPTDGTGLQWVDEDAVHITGPAIT